MHEKFHHDDSDCLYHLLLKQLIKKTLDAGKDGIIHELLNPGISDAVQTKKIRKFIADEFQIIIPEDITIRVRTGDRLPSKSEVEKDCLEKAKIHYLIIPKDWQAWRQDTSRW